MERVAQTQSTASSTTCAGCGGTVDSSRCGHCGALHHAGPYKVLRVISRSPHGAMYLAEDTHGAKVALKELVFSLVPGAEELDAFEREAKLLQALSHPRIPKFLKSFTVGQGVSTRLYLAQQFVTGQSLTQRLEHEHFDEASATALAKQALEVLAYLHERSPLVVHRDVKPDNFIWGANGELSLVDFGAARVVRSAGTHRATLVGTFGYMAPEQLGGTVDARSDLYGLGATLVHLLSRTPPERLMNSGMQLEFAKHLNVSVKFERFIARLVAQRPEERFSSARQALAALEGADVGPRVKGTVGPMFLVAALSVALIAGGVGLLAFRSPRVEQAADPVVLPQEKAVEPVAVPEQPLKLGEVKKPPAGEVRFPHQLASWDFKSPGHWIIDGSGHGNHALLPTSGYANDFFGLKWDGTQDITLGDSAFLAPKGPFTLNVSLQMSDVHGQDAVLFSRGDPGGAYAMKVELFSAGKVRFSVQNEKGEVSAIEGVVTEDQFANLHFSFDPKTGEQRIYSGCTRLAQTVTLVRPRRSLPADAQVHLAKGFRGVMQQIELERGLFKVTSSGKQSCSSTLERMDEE
ncbi:MAG: serine/threonine protein kinase [Archangium sp.]|nr:serine/threonine protein kinase [Archangium sp.]